MLSNTAQCCSLLAVHALLSTSKTPAGLTLNQDHVKDAVMVLMSRG